MIMLSKKDQDSEVVITVCLPDGTSYDQVVQQFKLFSLAIGFAKETIEEYINE